MKKIATLFVMVCLTTIGFCQVPTAKFLIQPDRTFKTAEGDNKVEIEFKDFSIGSFHNTVLMAAQYHSGQPCSYIEGKSINIHGHEFYAQGPGKTFIYVFNFCLMLHPNQHKITILAPKWDHTVYDGRPYYWSKTDYFKSNGERKEDNFLIEELVNNFLNGIIQTIMDNPSR